VPRNIEIKARIDSIAQLLARAARLADQGPMALQQDDTFFLCPSGRLKLREFGDGTAELIFYQRPDSAGPKPSFYVRMPTAAPDSLRQTLSRAYGVIGRVRKQRTLFLAGRTRIHVDRVAGLGDFLELEVVLEETERADLGVREAETLMACLGIQPGQLVAGAYLDLLRAPPPPPEAGL
jgi:adenylate cyclase class IV